MEYAIHRISLDIRSTKTQTNIRVKQADTCRKIYISLTEGGFPYHIAKDCSANFSAVKPDGNYVHNVCQIDGDTIIYTFTEQTVPVVGIMDCEISLYDGNKNRITSPHFNILVEERVYNGEEIISSPEANVLDELIGRAEHAVAQAEGFVDDINFRVNNSFANAFKGKLSGAVVHADDVSPIEHIVGCKVRNKNLFNTSDDYNGYDYTYAPETLTVTGRYIHKFITLEEDKTYTFSCKSTRTGTEGGGVYIAAFTKDKSNSVIISSAANINILSPTVTITVPAGYPIIRFTLYGYYTSTGSGTATYTEIMLEEGSTATEYVPYIEDLSAVVVNRCGKNLVSPNLHTGKMGGYTYSPNEDGSVTISGAATTTSQHVIALALKNSSGENETVRLVPNQTYTLTIYKDGEKTTGVGTKVEFDDGTIKWGFDKVSTKPRKLTLVYVQFTPVVGDTEHCGTYHVQLELGDKATEYEKYIGEEYSVAADGTVDGMLSLSPYMTIFSDTANVLIDSEYNKDSNKVYEELYNFLEQGGLTGTVPAARIANVKILADKWVGTESPYSQVVTIEGITENSQVDLTPSAEQLAIFYNKDLAFVTENENGVVTVYAIGQKPANDYTIQATITEVIV